MDGAHMPTRSAVVARDPVISDTVGLALLPLGAAAMLAVAGSVDDPTAVLIMAAVAGFLVSIWLLILYTDV